MATLVALELAFLKSQAVWTSAAMGVPKGGLVFGQRLPHRQQADGEGTYDHAAPGGDHCEAARGDVLWEARHMPGIVGVIVPKRHLTEMTARQFFSCVLYVG